MKSVTRKFGLIARLGTLAALALAAHQATAAGTDPGVSVTNTATVNYSVSGTPQAAINSNTAEFLVDRRVDVSVDQVGSALTQVTPGQTGVFVEFIVTNLSNGLLDFNLAFAQLTSADGDVRGAGTTDTDDDMTNVTIAVSSASDGVGTPGAGPDPVLGGPTLINDLAEDDSIRVRLYAETPAALANLDIANLRLDATAADPATGTNLVASVTWTPGSIDNVFADTDNDGIESQADGFQAVSASLAVNKAQAVISDPLSSGFAIPGARVEYTITLDNSAGTVPATDIVITDDVDTDVTFVADAYNGGAANIEFGGGAFCLAEAGDANGDGCTFDGTTLTIEEMSGAPISVANGASLTVSFVVEIPST
jgi:uncharacterized repeat protein (TIGR01451 family)